jgi:peroxiredoxin
MAANARYVAPFARRISVFLTFLAMANLVIAVLNPNPALAANPGPGDPAPDFSLADMGGTTRTLSEFAGEKVVLLDFWSIYCVACLQEMPHLVELYEKYKDQGFEIYGIDLDSFSPRRVQKFIDGLQYKIPYPVMIDRKREVAGAYKVGMLPTTILVGKDGKIKMVHIGFKPEDVEEFEHLIKKLLK